MTIIEENVPSNDGGELDTNEALGQLVVILDAVHTSLSDALEILQTMRKQDGIGSLIATILLVHVVNSGRSIEDVFKFLKSIQGKECSVEVLVKYMMNELKGDALSGNLKHLFEHLNEEK